MSYFVGAVMYALVFIAGVYAGRKIEQFIRKHT